MKTTLEIPGGIFRRAKSIAAKQGISLREFVTEAVKDKLAANSKAGEKQSHGEIKAFANQ